MVKHKKYHLLLFYLLAGIFMNADKSFSNDNNLIPDYIYGKVVYADNKSPVSNGNVKVTSVNVSGEKEKVIEIVEINENGEFRISRNLVPETDEIEIMAYANDLDNIEFQFETMETNLENALKTADGKFDIILTVERIINPDLND